jgi:hypothetical protein
MRLMYPLGLLGLIAIPILIIIYIIKNKYTEQIVPSTYLWTLSEKFLKRRNPINRLTGIISLILQILAVICISLAIAHPVFTLKGSAYSYCFILDGSGSMNMEQTYSNGKKSTRFEMGKQEISNIINSSATGSTYTLIFAGNTTDVVYENLDSKDRANTLLADLSASHTAATLTDALGVAQNYFDDNPSLKNYLVTDKSYESTQNVEVITISSHEENYALNGVTCALSGGGTVLTVSGNVFSYETDAEVTLALYIDGATTPEKTITVNTQKLVASPFTIESESVSYSSVKVAILNSDVLSLDNESVIYNVAYDNSYKTLIVSDAPFYIQAVLKSLGNVQATVVKTAEYTPTTGYGLYIFDGYSPSTLPQDGAVWFFNPVSSVQYSGFSVTDTKELDVAGKLVYNTSTSTKVKNLFKNTIGDTISVKRYVVCGLNRAFTTLLSYAGSPIVFAGTNSYGNREVVFAFDLQDSDIIASYDFIPLASNLFDYTFPPIVEEASYVCGDSAQINVLANCEGIRVETPSGSTVYLDTSSDTVDYTLEEAGEYTITLNMGSVLRTVQIYANMPIAESATSVSEASFAIYGEASDKKRDGRYEELIYLFIILAVIFIADWMVYCYEQYQLR